MNKIKNILLKPFIYLFGLESEKRNNIKYSLFTIEYLHEKKMLNKDGEELYKSIKKVIK